MRSVRLQREARDRWVALGALGAVSTLGLGVGDPTVGRWGPIAIALLPAVLVHMALTFPRATDFALKNPAAIGLGYVGCAVPAVVAVRASQQGPDVGHMLVIIAGGLAAPAAAALCVRLAHALSPSEDIATRTSAAIVLTGIGISVLSPGLETIGIPVRPALAVFPISAIASEFWLAARHHRDPRLPHLAKPGEGIGLEDIARGLAHAMRKPLKAVSDQLRDLRGAGAVPPRLEREIASGIDLLDQMERLVGDLLSLVSGRSPAEPRALAASKVIHLALEEVRPRFPTAEIELRSQGDPLLLGDEVSLRCVLVNLLENAFAVAPSAA